MTRTPGPWDYRPFEFDDWGWVRARNGGNLVAIAKDMTADHHAHRQAGTDPYEANARLIAAAPDLLAAALKLEEAEDHHANCEECEGEGLPELCRLCFPLFDDARCMRRAAIAKAQGDAHSMTAKEIRPCTFPDCALPAPAFRAELERFRRELGEAQATVIHLTAHVRDAGIDNVRLRRVNAELVGAITPFVQKYEKSREPYLRRGEAAAAWFDKMPGEWPLETTGFTMNHYRRAIAALRAAAETKDGRCPRCNSPSPERHPAVQHESEVQICPHPFHATETKDEPLCPRPANSAPPGPVTVRECVARGECGCDETKGNPT